MKKHYRKQFIFLLLALIFALAALLPLGKRVAAEQKQHTVAVVMTLEDLKTLSETSNIPESEWMKALYEAGLTGIMMTESALDDDMLTQEITNCGLIPIQQGGAARGGLYFFATKYDKKAMDLDTGMNVDEETIRPAALMRSITESGSTLVLVENAIQTGSILPRGVRIPSDISNALKCFWLNPTYRDRYAVLGYSGSEEIVNILFRAVIDRGINVLWIAPMVHDETIVSDLSEYTDLLQSLYARIHPSGYSYGLPEGLEAISVSKPILFLCGIGIAAAAIYLLSLLTEWNRNWILWLLFALGAAECGIGAWRFPSLQTTFLSLAASMIFPAISIVIFSRQLRASLDASSCSIRQFLCTAVLCVGIVLVGCCYIGGILGSSDYILILHVFRGVKLSQIGVYLFALIMMAVSLLHSRGNRLIDDIRTAPKISRRLITQLLAVVVILVGIGTIYIMRSGDGMLSVPVLEQRVRNWFETVLVYRPRTKEFLISWPSMALAFCFAARRMRLFSWLFGTLGSIGFASMANTFCHIRAHFLISVARTAFGLLIGFSLGMILYFLFRPAKES